LGGRKYTSQGRVEITIGILLVANPFRDNTMEVKMDGGRDEIERGIGLGTGVGIRECSL
jgi:hypothetical protein